MKLELVSLCWISVFVAIGGSKRISVATTSEIIAPYPNDEQHSSSLYFPWTHEPVCTDHLDGINDKLCVYTNATFSNGRGISIFTTNRVAKDFARLPPFRDVKALSHVSYEINPVADPTKQPWYTSMLPSKGLGMFASRPLQRGDQITAYTPYLIAQGENMLSTEERERFLTLAVSQLPPASRDSYLSLAKIYNLPSVVVQDVLKANAFELQVGGVMHLAVFPESSRFNHGCAPNAQYFLAADLLTHYVHAVRPIEKDEELTISYAPPLRMYADRQQYFQSTFQFTCTCPRCVPDSQAHSPPRTIDDSDKATQDIIALQWALGQWTPNSTASVRKAEMLVNLYKQEGLDAFLDDAYGHAALTYNSVGSARGAAKYAKLAAEASWLKFGSESVGMEKIREWEAIATDPRGHSSWRKRRPETEL